MTEKKHKEVENPLTLKWLTSLIVADIDIFLLQNDEQTADNTKEHFTREEIRNQLEKTCSKVCEELQKIGYNINKPLTYRLIDSLKIE